MTRSTPPASARSRTSLPAASHFGAPDHQVAMLRRVPLFAGLDLPQLQGLAASMQRQEVRAGASIVTQGRAGGVLFILQSGHALQVRADAQGREFILGDLYPGDHFGEMSLVDGLPHSAHVRARASCIVLTLGGAAFARCLASDLGLRAKVLQALSGRLRRATATIGTLAFADVRGRVAVKLLEMSEEEGGRRVIRGRLSRTELSRRVGASREMVSRLLGEMQAQGLLQADERGRLTLNTEPPPQR
jgi:CRP/FNR family cyclic AMP-dependent transcriptional regulator